MRSLSYLSRLDVGDGGRAEMDGGGVGQGTCATDENTQITEAAQYLYSQGEVVAGPQVSITVGLGPHSQLHM